MAKEVTDRVTGLFFVYTIPPFSRSYVECTGGAANPIRPSPGPVMRNCGVCRPTTKSLRVSRQSTRVRDTICVGSEIRFESGTGIDRVSVGVFVSCAICTLPTRCVGKTLNVAGTVLMVAATDYQRSDIR